MSDHDSPAELSRDDWRVILRRTVHEYRINAVHDIAAALTYYAVLAVFPALLATLATVGIFGNAQAGAENALEVIGDVGGESAAEALREPLEQLVNASNAALAFITGVVGVLWAASSYVGIFGRGMNRIYGVAEGRPFWEMRPTMIGVSALIVVLGSIVAFALIVSGPVADSLARVLGLDEGIVLWWDLGKLPVLVGVVMLVIALLYWAAPNVKRRNFRWLSVGAVGAVLAWVVTTALFALYVIGFDSYQRTYGVVGGIIAFLLWVWLSNLAMLFGAVLDTEVERARQLRAGIVAEEFVQLPLRNDRLIEKNRERRVRDIRASAAMREDTAVDGLARPAEPDPDPESPGRQHQQ